MRVHSPSCTTAIGTKTKGEGSPWGPRFVGSYVAKGRLEDKVIIMYGKGSAGGE